MRLITSLAIAAAACVAAASTQVSVAQPPFGGGTPAPTLPEVVVRPDTQAPGNVGGNGDGSISWSSDAIGSFDTLVGPYQQPDWTTQRVFPTTRVYVLPAGTAEVEQWVRPTWPRAGNTEFRFLEEFAVGLPGRFQLDLYERWNIEPDSNNQQQANHEGVQVELRWAMADWDVIPLNPTLYAEWIERGGPQDKPNKFELKLLFGENLSSRLFYASNLIWEQEVDGECESEYAWSHALTTPLVEERLLTGIECRLASITEKGARDNPSIEFLIGPSIQWRPTNRTFVDVTGLVGTTADSPASQMYVVFGYQFGTRAGPSSGYVSRPVSARGN